MLEEYWHCARRDENVMEGKESVPLGEIALTVTPRHTPPAAYIICVLIISLYTAKLLLYTNRDAYKALKTVKPLGCLL